MQAAWKRLRDAYVRTDAKKEAAKVHGTAPDFTFYEQQINRILYFLLPYISHKSTKDSPNNNKNKTKPEYCQYEILHGYEKHVLESIKKSSSKPTAGSPPLPAIIQKSSKKPTSSVTNSSSKLTGGSTVLKVKNTTKVIFPENAYDAERRKAADTKSHLKLACLSNVQKENAMLKVTETDDRLESAKTLNDALQQMPFKKQGKCLRRILKKMTEFNTSTK